jgi:hypothetical protein
VSARALAASVVLTLGSLGLAACSSAGAAHDTPTVTAVRPPRACPPGQLVFLARFRPRADDDPQDVQDRWLLMLAAERATAVDDLPAFAELDADTARRVHLAPPAKLWIDDGDGTWCEARPAAVYRDVWRDGPVGFEYGVELDATCSDPAHRDAVVRVAVAGVRPPAGCRVDSGVQDITARTAAWNVADNTFEPPADAPAIPDVVAAAIAPAPPCTGACLALWHVSALMSRGAPAVWQVERAWVTPDRAQLCSSSAQSGFDVLVARGSAVAPLAIHPDRPGLDPDLFAALEDDGGVRVLVTSLPGDYATWDLDAMHLARRLYWGFPNPAELAAAHALGPVCDR